MIPASLRECTHIDEVHRLVTETRGLRGTAIEIGSARGRSALPLAIMFAKLYVVDLWPHNNGDMEACLNLLAPYIDKITILRGLSWEMAGQISDESADYFFLDADHHYESVKKDLPAYYRKLRPGVGAVASGHDYSQQFAGCKQAVDEFVAELGIPYVNTSLGLSESWAFEKP